MSSMDLLTQGVSKNYALQCKTLALLIILHHEAHEEHEGFNIRVLKAWVHWNELISGWLNSIFVLFVVNKSSGTIYHVSPEGLSIRDDTNNS